MKKTFNFKRLARRTTVVIVLLAIAPLTAQAAFIDFSGSIKGGSTLFGSMPAPFHAGDALTGYLEIDDAAAQPGARFDNSDLLGWGLSIGSVDFTQSALSTSLFSGRIADDGSALSSFELGSLFVSMPNCENCTVGLTSSQTGFIALVKDFCNPWLSGLIWGQLDTDLRVPPSIDPPTDVAEPAPLALFAIALVFIGWGMRRRARS
ncbi:hypothetical protein [Salinisphaera sp. T31B1]|uniref:hypothetical protein n=1 Tax=Salinisphaera sp. T31B1 TaxID=727963 RepID=UPI003341D0F4